MMDTRLVPALLLGMLLFTACGAPRDAASAAADAAIPATTPVTSDTPTAGAATEDAQPGAMADTEPESSPAAGGETTSACPQAAEGTTLYVSTDNGFCFLYPSSLELGDDPSYPGEAVQLLGSPADPTAMETVALNLGVANNGPADGLDSAGYASAWLAANAPGLDLPRTPATIGGQPAMLVENVPSMWSGRSAFIVANGTKYRINLQPQPQDVPELADAGTQVWDTLTQSIVFFPPQKPRSVVRPQDVCPAVTADTKLLINEGSGYCLLYPADFDLDPNMLGAIVGGPELGPFADFPSLRASLTVGGAYPLAGKAPEQVLQPGPDNIDPNSVAPTTIAGYPAVTYDFVTGPWGQRNAAVVVGDRYYTFVVQPWDAGRFPQALSDVQRLWQTASESLAFFDPWR